MTELPGDRLPWPVLARLALPGTASAEGVEGVEDVEDVEDVKDGEKPVQDASPGDHAWPPAEPGRRVQWRTERASITVQIGGDARCHARDALRTLQNMPVRIGHPPVVPAR